MTNIRVGVIMNGVTGRMGRNQHLFRSLLEINRQGGVACGDDQILADPLLVGRNEAKLKQLSAESGVQKWTTDLAAALGDADFPIYFDAQSTSLRFSSVSQAIQAGKHIYCEKPTALNCEEAVRLAGLARRAGLKNGVVQDKLWLPGILKLKTLIQTGCLGKILSVRGEFGYWVFDGDPVSCQRPSWNYRKEDGGGIINDMFPHWRYLLDDLFGGVSALSTVAATHIHSRRDEKGELYECTAEDAAYATFRLPEGVIAHFNSSWAVRVRRDDLLTLQVDGTRGSAVAGLRNCWLQPLEGTPRPVWNPDVESPIDYRSDWLRVPEQRSYDNAFKVQWELFLRHVVAENPFPWDLLAGARGVQLAELALQSWEQGSWLTVEPLQAAD